MNLRAIIFIAVGATGFIVQMAVLSALSVGAHWGPAPATALAVEAAVLTNFFWHERWTWRDRNITTIGRFQRLCRFHLANGVMSIVGNVVVTTTAVGLLGMNAVVANVLAVVLLSVINYLTADRWVFAGRRGLVAVAILMLSAWPASAAELGPETIAAWNHHVARVEASLPLHEREASVTEPQGRTIDVPGGTLHEWRGSILIRDVTVTQIVDALLSPGSQPLQEDVADSRVLERHGDSLRMYLKLVRKVIVTVTYDTEHDVRYARRSPTFATSRSVATRIVEAGGSDRGFLWRLNSYWRYSQVGDAVQVDVLSLSLSRDVPWIVKPIAQPLIERIGRESMSRTLLTVERTAAAARKRAGITAGRANEQ